MNTKKLLATLALSAILFTGCSLKPTATIIKVNNRRITQEQFDKTLDKQLANSMFAKMGIDIRNGKNTFVYIMMKDRVVNELIIRTLIEEEIAKRKIEVTNADVEEEIKNIIDQVGSKEELDKLLKENGISTSDFKKDLKEEVKMKKLANALGVTAATEAEAKDFYNKNTDKFKYPEKVRASHILISVNPDEIKEIITSDEANKNLTPAEIQKKVDEQVKAKKAKADQLLAQAKQNPSEFAKLAKENSEDTASATKGGDLGFFAEQDMVPEFSKAAFSMKPNTVSKDLVKSQYGYHIIMVVDRMAAGQDSFEKVKTDIINYLNKQKQVEAIDKLVESLKKTAKIEYVNSEYDPENIKKELQDTMKKDAAPGVETEPKAKDDKKAAPATPAAPAKK